MLQVQISHIWAKWFWRRFLNIFLCMSMVQTQDPPTPVAVVILDHETFFEQTWWSIRQRYIPNFKYLSQVVLEKISSIFLCISMVQTRPGPLPWDRANLDPETFIWTNLIKTTRQCWIPNFKHMSQVVWKKMSGYFSMYFCASTPGPLA